MEDLSEEVSKPSKAAIQIDLEELERLNQAKKKQVRKWQRRWVLVPNVYQFGEDIWVQKWVNEDQIEEQNQQLKRNREDPSNKIFCAPIVFDERSEIESVHYSEREKKVPNSASKKESDIAKALEKRGYGESSNIDKSLLRTNEEIEHNNIILRNNQIQLDKMKQNTDHE